MGREVRVLSDEAEKLHLSFFMLLAKRRSFVMKMAAGGAVLMLVISFLMGHKYSATATLLPPEKQSVGGLMSFLGGSSSVFDFMKGPQDPALDQFKNILDSRTLAEAIVEDPSVYRYFYKFDTSKVGVAKMVQAALESEALRNGMITVTVTVPTKLMPSSSEIDSAKRISAYLANIFVTELDRYNREKLMTTAKTTRLFVESEYKSRMILLDSAYARLQAYQEANKAVSLTDQLSAAVTSAAMLASQVQQLEMQIGVEERDLKPNSTRIAMLKAQLSESRNQLRRLDNGEVSEYSLAFKNTPELMRNLAALTREVKLLEQISAFLRQQVEQERIAEQRDLPSLQVLDPAVVPERRSSPSRTLMTVLGFFAGFLGSVAVVATTRVQSRMKQDPTLHPKLYNMVSAIRNGSKAQLIDAKSILSERNREIAAGIEMTEAHSKSVTHS